MCIRDSCFDELEIAPPWLRREVLESQRSIDQKFLLKLTSSPLLPSGLKSAPEAGHDFQNIRLWNSHVEDAQTFCEDMAQRFLRAHFPEQDVSPAQFLGYSPLAAEDGLKGDDRSYERGSMFYTEMRSLAAEDQAFRRELIKRGLNPDDPYSESIDVRDTFLRKIKPVVILRRVFRRPQRGRSRKVVTAYAGRQAIYAMSEGNPRWLLGILTDLHVRWLAVRTCDKTGLPVMRRNQQAKVLNSTARRFQTSLSAAAIREAAAQDGLTLGLREFLDLVGTSFSEGFLGEAFPTDPSGSFVVDPNLSLTLYRVLERALEKGALVYVGKSGEDVPREITGSRFRLSFLLSPVYRLPFRNYREILLSTLLGGKARLDQLSLFPRPNVSMEQQ